MSNLVSKICCKLILGCLEKIKGGKKRRDTWKRKKTKGIYTCEIFPFG